MQFNQIPRAVERFTQDQLRARELRLRDPQLQQKLEDMRQLLGGDIKRACGNGLGAAWRFTFGAPLSSMWEGTKEFGSIIGHNFSVKNPKNKRSYSEVPATMIKELAIQYGKGVIDISKLVGNLSVALSRATVLGARYTIGK